MNTKIHDDVKKTDLRLTGDESPLPEHPADGNNPVKGRNIPENKDEEISDEERQQLDCFAEIIVAIILNQQNLFDEEG